MSKRIPAELRGFTPLFDALIGKDLITTAVFGRMWRYCQMEDGVCKASLEKIANGIGLSSRTIMRHIDELIADGYLKDLTPDARNKPHVYADTGKIKMSLTIEATVTESHTGVTESHTGVTESHSGYDRESHPTMTESHMKKEEETIKESNARSRAQSPKFSPPTKPARPRDELFDAIAEVCKLNPALVGSRIAGTAKKLRKLEATPEQVREFLAWWQSDNWRRENHPNPSDAQLLSKWDISRGCHPSNAPRIPGKFVAVPVKAVNYDD